MKLRHIGYACLNLAIDETTNHTFRLARLSEEQAAQTTAKNLESLQRILDWNVSQGIRLFRIGSSLIPFASHEKFTLDWTNQFAPQLNSIREYVREHGLRLSMHPGQYTVLNSPNPKVVRDSVRELAWQAQVVSLLDPEQGTLVLHVGGAYGDKAASIQRFEENFANLLSPQIQQRLALENDDVTFNADEVLAVCQRLRIPMIFDLLHHKCLYQSLHWEEGLSQKLEQIVLTWRGKVPKLHLSSPRPGSRTTHADYITPEDFEELKTWMDTIRPTEYYDLMIEAKMKDKAVQALFAEARQPMAHS